jgi:hypothetical protein
MAVKGKSFKFILTLIIEGDPKGISKRVQMLPVNSRDMGNGAAQEENGPVLLT